MCDHRWVKDERACYLFNQRPAIYPPRAWSIYCVVKFNCWMIMPRIVELRADQRQTDADRFILIESGPAYDFAIGEAVQKTLIISLLSIAFRPSNLMINQSNQTY